MGWAATIPDVGLTEGERFAGFRIVGEIGAGGMGQVYLVEHPRLPRREALKILRADISADERFRQRFIREADSIADLEHPNIVTVYDRGEDEGRLWIATQYVDGTDAARLLGDRYPAGMPAVEAAAITTAIAEALDYAHGRGLLHRDVKPANILLAQPDRDGNQRAYLADFGIARPLDDTAGITATNFTLGTVAYAAPEQLMGKTIDGRADQYALAATAFHLLTGSPVFADSNQAAVIGRHLTEPAPPPSTIRPDLAPYDAVFARALAKNPTDRFPRCQDFARAITTAAAHSDTGYSPTAPTQQAPVLAKPAAAPIPVAEPAGNADRRRLPARAILAAMVVLGLLTAAALLWRPWVDRDQTSGVISMSTPTPTATQANPESSSGPLADIVLPQDVAASGKLLVGTNVPYTPAEFRDPQGRIVGFDIELIDAVAQELGLTTQIEDDDDFADLLPAVRSGNYDAVVAYLTTTQEREQVVDMLTYYSGGTLWAQRPGPPINPDDACGLTVAVQATTTQETDELPAKSQRCTAEGKSPITVVQSPTADSAIDAVLDGRADAFTADSIVTGYIVNRANGGLVPAGPMFDSAPVAWAVKKGSPLGPALQEGLRRIIASGQYREILQKWGVEVGAITDPKINAADR